MEFNGYVCYVPFSENDEWIDVPLSEEERERYVQSAKHTKSLQEKKQTSIRFSVQDLALIKVEVKELGIGYQNLIEGCCFQRTF